MKSIIYVALLYQHSLSLPLDAEISTELSSDQLV